MEMLRYYRGEDIITISKNANGKLYVEIETTPKSLFPIYFTLNIFEIAELERFLNKKLLNKVL